MLIIRNERGIVIAQAEISGESRRPTENRELLGWLQSCPQPGVVHLSIDGEKVNTENLFGKNLQTSSTAHAICANSKVIQMMCPLIRRES